MALERNDANALELLGNLQIELPDRMIALIDTEGKIIFRSSTLLNCKNCGMRNAGESIHHRPDCAIYEIFGDSSVQTLDELKESIEKTVSVRAPDGIVHSLRTMLTPLKNQKNSIVAYLFVVADETVLRDTQEELSAKSTLLENILMSIEDVIWLKDTSGRFLMCNKQFELYAGGYQDEIIGKTDYEFFDEETARAHIAHDEMVLRLGKSNKQEEWLRYPDGKEALCETIKTPLRDNEGNTIGVLGVARDITVRKSMEEKLRLTQFSVENASLPIFWVDALSGLIFYANEAACQSLGYTLSELTRLTIVQIDPNFDETRWEEHAENLEKTKKAHFKTRHRKKDGTIFPVEVIASIMTYRGKNYNVAFAIDISEREAKEKALKQSEAMLRESQEIAKIGSWELDFQTNELTWSEQVYTILGLSRGDGSQMFKDFIETIYPDDREMVVGAYEESLKDDAKPYDIVHRALVKGKMKYLHEQCRTSKDGNGKPLRSIGTVRDVTDEQELMEQVAYLSHHDSLTRLPNQLHFKQELVYALRRAKKTNTLVAVCFIDLDDFKYVNDVYGHGLGDQVLQTIASRLLSLQPYEHSVARFGADEFVVLIEDIDNAAQATLQLEPILKAIREPVMLQGKKIEVGASAGISLYPTDGAEPEDLIKFADAATHRAKSLGKNRLTFYTEDFTNEMSQKMRLLSTMRSAIGTEQFVLYYQPQVDLSTLKICGVEALIRWEHPEFGFTPPDVFIPTAEESRLIVPLGEWILEQACAQMAAWIKMGIFDKAVAVNVSGIQLEAEGFAQHVKNALEKSGLDPKHLELEITESSLMGNVDAWLGTLADLGDLGVHLAIDDFGTGYSSLSHLRQMPVDVLKIDRTFVWDLPHKSGACAIAKTVVGLAENMKMHALAEGIETKEQLRFLQEAGCEKGQGFYFSKPLPASEVEVLFRQTHPFDDKGK